MNNLNEKLKQLRMDGKFTQQQIADHLFVSRQAVSNWENGKNIPDLSTIILLSRRSEKRGNFHTRSSW